ncbi:MULTISPECIES: hypothetical protein [unclassified Streptomyces]|uniref:hypothetical protein n=1 Tax=unclassified Streptomyces TaxID=2593676 RepID=UPI0013144312|nr:MULTISPECIES: hypothetical protein [unclassified Streptomyces]
MMWRSRRHEHDQNSNSTSPGSPSGGRSSGGPGRGNGRGNGGRNNGSGLRNQGPGSGGSGRHRTSNGLGASNSSSGTGAQKKPKIKDPVADRLSKLGKGLANKLKNRGATDKTPKNSSGTDEKNGKKNRNRKSNGDGAPWASTPDGLGPKTPKDRKDKKDRDRKKRRRNSNGAGDESSATARDGLEPKNPKRPGGGTGGVPPKPGYAPDEVIDAELVDDDYPPRPRKVPGDVIDGEVIDEDRIALIRAKREKARRRQAAIAGKKAAAQAARDGDMGDPRTVRRQVTARANHVIDLEVHRQDHLLDLTAAAETPRSTPVNYPAIPAGPVATRTAGVAIARRIDHRGTTAYLILRAMADQLTHGLHSDADADMADHIVELTGIPNMCKNLSVAVKEAAQALARTAPLHPSVIKHLENAAVAARTAGVMSESIMTVFVQAHREDIIRVLDPRLGEERWNIRNARGTLDAAKLRAAIATANTNRRALPASSSGQSGAGQGVSKLVPVSDASTKKLIDLMKNFNRGHMVTVLSEVYGAQAGVDAVADSINKLYKRMQDTWPTENVVDETVHRTAGQVRRVAAEIRKAISAAQKAHERELRLNSVGRAGKGAYAERKWDVVGRTSSSN